MVKGESIEWVDRSTTQFFTHFIYELPDSLKLIEVELVKVLLNQYRPINQHIPLQLLEQYSLGGANYESVAVWLHQLLLSLPTERFYQVSDLLISKVLLRMSWSQCANQFQLTGRKQIEQSVKQELAGIIGNLQCKTE